MRPRKQLLVVWLGTCLGCAAAGAHGSGAPQAGREDARHGAPVAPAPAPSVADAERALEAGDPARAEAILRGAAAAAPSDGAPWLALARLHVAQRRFADAVADLDRAVAIRETAETLTLRGRALGLDRRFDDAARDLERAVALDGKSVDAWAVLAAVQVNRGDALEAERAYGAAAASSDKPTAVNRVWTQLLAMPPDPVAPQETLDRCTRGYVAGLQGEWLEAERELRSGLRFAPSYGWCLAQWAESLGRAGAFARAEAVFRQSIAAFSASQRPLRADTEGRLAALYVSTGKKTAEAVELSRAALAVRGERAALLFVLGRACDASGDTACSRDAYRRMLALPHVPDALRSSAEDRLRRIGTPAPTASR